MDEDAVPPDLDPAWLPPPPPPPPPPSAPDPVPPAPFAEGEIPVPEGAIVVEETVETAGVTQDDSQDYGEGDMPDIPSDDSFLGQLDDLEEELNEVIDEGNDLLEAPAAVDDEEDNEPVAARLPNRRLRGINRRYHGGDFYNCGQVFEKGDMLLQKLDWNVPPTSEMSKAIAMYSELQ